MATTTTQKFYTYDGLNWDVSARSKSLLTLQIGILSQHTNEAYWSTIDDVKSRLAECRRKLTVMLASDAFRDIHFLIHPHTKETKP